MQLKYPALTPLGRPSITSFIFILIFMSTGCDQSHDSGHIFEVVSNKGLPKLGKTYGASVLYLNGDDLPDLVMSTHGNHASHYINQGHGEFQRALADSALPMILDQHGSATCDYNNDGLWDTYLTAGAQQGKSWGPNQLWLRLADGSVVDQALDTPILADQIGRGRGALWVNFDGDANLDILVLNYQSPIRLIVKTPTGWRDDTSSLPVIPDFPFWTNKQRVPTKLERGASAWSHSACVGDFNNDGWSDLILIGTAGSSGLWLNDQSGQLTDYTSKGNFRSAVWPNTPTHVATADLNEDGMLDVVLIYPPDNRDKPNWSPIEVWINHKSQDFGFHSPSQKIEFPPDIVPVSCILEDLDNDGHLDIFVAAKNGKNDRAKNIILKGKGDGTFDLDMKYMNSQPNDTGTPESAIIFDFDLDGDLDLVSFNGGAENPGLNLGVRKYKNASTNKGLTLELVDPTGVPHGLGARVFCMGQMREVKSVATPFSSSILPVHFGLGAHNEDVDIVVYWPKTGGKVTRQLVTVDSAGAAYRLVKGQTECIKLTPSR